MHNKMLAKLLALVMALILSMSMAVSVYAAEGTEGPCTVEVITKDDEGNGLDGFKVALFQIAELKEDGSYSFTEDFKDAGYTIAQFTHGEVTDDMCRKLRDYAKSNELTPVGELVTDTEGETKFENLPKGIYLFINTERTGTASAYYEFIPGVVSAPVWGETGANFVSQAFPKIEKFTGEKPTPTPPPEDNPPQTGDSSNIDLWNRLMYCSIGGIFLFGVFAIICGRKEDAEEDWD